MTNKEDPSNNPQNVVSIADCPSSIKNFPKLHKNDFKIIHTNVRSLYPNKLDSLKLLAIKQNPSIICVSETWLTSSIPNSAVNIPNYNIYRYDNNTKYGSTCIYTHHEIDVKVISAPDAKYLHGFDFLPLQVQYKKFKSFIVVVIYLRPPVTLEILEEYFKLTRFLISLDKRFYILGDFNINYMDKNNFLTKKIIKFTDIHKLKQVITEPTRCTNNSNTLIDLCILNNADFNYATSSNLDNIADHNTISVSINLKSPKFKNYVTKTYRTHKFYNKESLNNFLKLNPFNLNEDTDIDSTLDCFNKHLTKSIDEVAPLITKTFKANTIILTHDILTMIKDKKKILKQIKSNPIHTTTHNILKKQIEKEIKKQKSQMIKDKIKQCGQNNYKLWKLIKHITPYKDPLTSFTDSMLNKETANSFNQYFSTIGETTYKDLIKCNTNSIPTNCTEQSVFPKFIIKPTNPWKVAKIIKHLKTSSSIGVDLISTNYIKDAAETIAPIISNIINKSIATNKVPKTWKTAVILPIYKKVGNKTDPHNYRPISILPVLSKVMEKVVSTQLNTHLESYKILQNTQFGFRNGASTNNALNHACNILYTSLDNNNISLLVLLDLSKAFDSISHEILIEKMKLYNVHSEWINDYLMNRLQITKIGKCHSVPLPISYGVPQGSILGPTLFNIFVNELKNYLKRFCDDLIKMDVISYADDTQLIFTSKFHHFAEIKIHAENILNNLIEWYTNLGLKLNINKTQCMLISSKTHNNKIPHSEKFLKLNSQNIKFADSVLNLGITFDNDMKFKSHVNNIYKKVHSKLIYLNKTRNFHTKLTRKLLIESLAFSQINYCLEIWNTLSNFQINMIQKLINFGAKIVFRRNKFDRASECIKELKWLNANQLIKYYVGCSIFKEINELTNLNIKKSLIITDGIRMRNGELKYDIPNYKTQYGQYKFTYRSLTLWNSLPLKLKNIKSFEIFKIHFKNFLLEDG